MKWIVSDQVLLNQRLNEIHAKFSRRGYPTPLLAKQRLEVEQCNRKNMSLGRPKKNLDHIPFVSTYSNISPQVANILCKYGGILRDEIPNVPS